MRRSMRVCICGTSLVCNWCEFASSLSFSLLMSLCLLVTHGNFFRIFMFYSQTHCRHIYMHASHKCHFASYTSAYSGSNKQMFIWLMYVCMYVGNMHMWSVCVCVNASYAVPDVSFKLDVKGMQRWRQLCVTMETNTFLASGSNIWIDWRNFFIWIKSLIRNVLIPCARLEYDAMTSYCQTQLPQLFLCCHRCNQNSYSNELIDK